MDTHVSRRTEAIIILLHALPSDAPVYTAEHVRTNYNWCIQTAY